MSPFGLEKGLSILRVATIFEPIKSLLYHGFGIKGYCHLGTRYQKGEIEAEPEDKPQAPEGQKLVRQ